LVKSNKTLEQRVEALEKIKPKLKSMFDNNLGNLDMEKLNREVELLKKRVTLLEEMLKRARTK